MILGPALCVSLCLLLLNCWDSGQTAQHGALPSLRKKEMVVKGKNLSRKYQDKPTMENYPKDTRFGVRSSAQTGKVSDLNQQVWILRGQSLVAVPQNSNVAPATIAVLPCKYPESLEQGKGIPIYLGIQNPDKCLFCEEVDGQPTLQLKEENILDLYNSSEPVKPFLFYHTQTGTTSTFESVAFPGSFIASSKNGQPIFLTSEQGKYHNINFNLVLGP